VVGYCPEKYRSADNRFIYTGRVSETEYVDLLRAMDVLLVPRVTPTFGAQYKVLQAMSTGTLVVQTPYTSLPFGAADGRELFVAKVEEFPQVVNKILSGRYDLDRMRWRARELIRSAYSFEVVRQNLLMTLPTR
jgi:glycosyltransferase involved in cell wall biosynthesis